MGKWLYLAKIIGYARDSASVVGILSIAGLCFFTYVYFDLDGADRKRVLGYIKKCGALALIMGTLTGLIPTKEEAIQIMLLEQVNTENYNLMTEEISKGVDKILEVLNKTDKEKE